MDILSKNENGKTSYSWNGGTQWTPSLKIARIRWLVENDPAALRPEAPSMTEEQNDKVRENRARRAAERQGLLLKKSRRRDPRAIDYGTYMLVDASTNTIVAGERMYLDDVEKYLAS
jgi:hypothetical protein